LIRCSLRAWTLSSRRKGYFRIQRVRLAASRVPESSPTITGRISMARSVNRVAIIGTGVIGASWSALFLAKGLEVVATDVAPNAEAALKRFIESAWPAVKRLGLATGASQSRLSFTADLATAVKGADLVQENGPERIEFKRKLYG